MIVTDKRRGLWLRCFPALMTSHTSLQSWRLPPLSNNSPRPAAICQLKRTHRHLQVQSGLAHSRCGHPPRPSRVANHWCPREGWYDMTQVYLPPQEDYCGPVGVPLGPELCRYADQEFPEARGDDVCTVYAVPKMAIPRSEQRASEAEQLVFQRLSALRVPGLWAVFFQGRVYGARSSRGDRAGRLVIREHDFVIFTRRSGSYQVTLAEVKSTCEAACNAQAVKNSKRSAQHQLRDHVEMMTGDLELGAELKGRLNTFIMWPFLCGETTDPANRPVRRWQGEAGHVFKDSFEDQDSFCDWFQEAVLARGSSLPEDIFRKLFTRFVMLSCGVYVDEIHEGLLALLSQEQVQLLHSDGPGPGRPLVVHGAAGTGKTLLVVKKLQRLWQEGRLHNTARALYVCYWPGIRADVTSKLQVLGLADFVDTARFYIATPGFLRGNNRPYKHVFMDEAEAVCLSFEEGIITRTFQELHRHYQLGNSGGTGAEPWGAFWFLVDINQASLFLPKHSPDLLKSADVVLCKVMRSTRTIYQLFKQFYDDPIPRLPPRIKELTYGSIRELCVGHEVLGPPVYWVDVDEHPSVLDGVVAVVVDLCSAKGIRPNDLCVLPFLVNETTSAHAINGGIRGLFAEGGFMPSALSNVESFVLGRQPCHFVTPWVLRVKGLEFKTVVMVIEDDDFDVADAEDRRKMYIMASRCTCLLVMVCSSMVRRAVDCGHITRRYPFSASLCSTTTANTCLH